MAFFRPNYKTKTDEELYSQMSSGEKRAFDELYMRYADKLCYFFLIKLKNDKEKSEDFVHDLFSKIIHKPELFDTTRSFKTWVYSIANNMCINEYKKMSVRSNTSIGLDESYNIRNFERSQDSNVHYNDFKQSLDSALVEMDSKHSEVFELRFFQDLSIKEIAEIVGINDGTVKSRLFYASKRLAQKLGDFNPILNE